jgi:hypothetical protein
VLTDDFAGGERSVVDVHFYGLKIQVLDLGKVKENVGEIARSKA